MNPVVGLSVAFFLGFGLGCYFCIFWFDAEDTYYLLLLGVGCGFEDIFLGGGGWWVDTKGGCVGWLSFLVFCYTGRTNRKAEKLGNCNIAQLVVP